MKPYMYQPRAASCVEVRNRRRNSSSSANLEAQSELDDSSSAEASTCANSDSQHLGLSARPDSLHGIPESYVQPRPDLMRSSDRYPGLMEDGRGDLYAVDGENVYAVRRDPDNATWRVYDRQAPSRPAYPIRPAQGGWEVHGDVGLKGGMLGDAEAMPEELIEDVVERWAVGERQHKSITAQYAPHQLCLEAYGHKRITVSDEVYQVLEDGQEINTLVKALLPYGSGNQRWDVELTRGESFKRLSVSRASRSASAGDILQFRTGAGNCGEMSMLAFAFAGSLFKDRPVLRVKEDGVDHRYVLVGDPRVPQCEQSTVVIDPWPSFPMIHLLTEGVGHPALSSAESSHHEPFVPEILPVLLRSEIDEIYSRESGKPADEASVLQDIETMDDEHPFLYAQRTAGNDPTTVYRSPSHPGGRVFDMLPDYLVDRYDPCI